MDPEALRANHNEQKDKMKALALSCLCKEKKNNKTKPWNLQFEIMINFQIEYEIGVTVQLGDNSHIAHKLYEMIP